MILLMSSGKVRSTFGHSNVNFSVYRPCEESISKEVNNDDLNLHSMTKMSGWLGYC